MISFKHFSESIDDDIKSHSNRRLAAILRNPNHPRHVEAKAERDRRKIANESREIYRQFNENTEGLKNKAEKSGMPLGILRQVYNRGVAAWKSGHRPGTTPEQWGMARVNSFITKSSGTWGKADKDLAAKVKG